MNNFYTIVRSNGGTIAWTDEQVAYIIDKYLNEKYTLAQLGREFNCSYGTIKNLLHNHNIQSRGNKQGFPRNEYYFYQINTIEKAYWLGFLYADGSIAANTNEIRLNITDKEHIEKFQQAIGAINHQIKTVEDRRWNNVKSIYYFSIKDNQLHRDLIKWGCVPQKCLILNNFPNIPCHYLSHFIRGYFDGNGSIHYLKGTNNFRISFIGTKNFLEEIKKYFNLNISIAQGTGQDYILQITGRKQVIKILNILYQNSTNQIRLNRKYQLYLDCLKWAGASPLNLDI